MRLLFFLRGFYKSSYEKKKGWIFMKKKLVKYIRRFVRYMQRTCVLKFYSLMWLSLGTLSAFVLEDITFLVFTMFIGVPLFFMKEA